MFQLFLLAAVASCVHCSIDHNQPSSLTVKPGGSLTVPCKISGYSLSDSSKAPSWIRQAEGKALEFIGMMHAGGSTDYKDSLKSKFSISRDTSSSTVFLNGQNLKAEDTAVYYCARYTGTNSMTIWRSRQDDQTPRMLKGKSPLGGCSSGNSP
ncbi:hypothetical protein MHYP_G00145600 [Metynnis hypsauchen]